MTGFLIRRRIPSNEGGRLVGRKGEINCIEGEDRIEGKVLYYRHLDEMQSGEGSFLRQVMVSCFYLLRRLWRILAGTSAVNVRGVDCIFNISKGNGYHIRQKTEKAYIICLAPTIELPKLPIQRTNTF